MKSVLVLALGLALASGLAAVPAKRAPGLKVLGSSGELRLYRFETEPWPLVTGSFLPGEARLELSKNALLRLRFGDDLDLALAGPARFAVYTVPSPEGPDAPGRLVLKLDQGSLLVDGRFQFGRPADLVLSLPDRDLPLKADQRFVAVAAQGRSRFYVPRLPGWDAAKDSPEAPGPGAAARGASVEALAATLSAGAVVALAPGSRLVGPVTLAPPAALLAETLRPVPVFVVARDFNKDLGQWPRPAVLGPLLAERMARVPGIRVVDGSGDTRFAYFANSALKKGQDDFLKSLAQQQGARWALVGNCVTDSPPGEGGRWVRGQAELRLLDAESPQGSLELVSEAAVTRVARAGRPLEQASRQAFETASDEAARYMVWQVEDLLRGRPHAVQLLKLEVDGANQAALEALRARLDLMDSVQRFFRRRYYGHVADFDVMLRRQPADFDAQWAAAPAVSGWTFRTLPSADPDERRVSALRAP